jgi:hypothetical protein
LKAEILESKAKDEILQTEEDILKINAGTYRFHPSSVKTETLVLKIRILELSRQNLKQLEKNLKWEEKCLVTAESNLKLEEDIFVVALEGTVAWDYVATQISARNTGTYRKYLIH